MTAHDLIQHFALQPHPEGGWYASTYRSLESIPAAALPPRFSGDRIFSTAIYFLLEKGNYSGFHRIQSDECWHFYCGGPLEIFILQADGDLQTITLGSDPAQGHHFQYVVPAGHWFASRPAPGTDHAFVGCTVAPGFDFADFEMADRYQLLQQFPVHADLLAELCR
ncbi:MAG: hypothetical protein RJA57_865 [Bacteroidota bacterium]|jgi:predicted cupin superfamily sugar epimerase